MLIPSHRHTPEDLRLWAELETADMEHGQSERLAKKVSIAKHAIASFLADGPAFCGVSWGKDSTALAHLVVSVSPDTPLVWTRWLGWDNPDSELVMKRFPSPSHVVTGPSNDSDDGREGFRLTRKKFGARRILGIRRDESGGRQVSAAVHGVATSHVCRPLLHWSATDVFAYLATRKLPVHPVYAMTGGGRWPRARLRVDCLGGRRGDGMGRAEWEREYYGDVLGKIANATGRANSDCRPS